MAGTSSETMQLITINKRGEREVDPYNNRGQHEAWLKRIGYFSNNIDYFSID